MFDNGTGVVDDLFFHDAGILTYLFGELSLESVRRYRLYHPDLADSAVVRFYAGKIPVELTLSWSFTGRRRGITIYSSDRIVEYDALAQGPQITVHRLESNEKEQLDFPQVQPLTALLEAFVSAVAFGLQVPFGPDFMKILVRLWRKVSNAR
jgi:predicted dehydrogenase